MYKNHWLKSHRHKNYLSHFFSNKGYVSRQAGLQLEHTIHQAIIILWNITIQYSPISLYKSLYHSNLNQKQLNDYICEKIAWLNSFSSQTDSEFYNSFQKNINIFLRWQYWSGFACQRNISNSLSNSSLFLLLSLLVSRSSVLLPFPVCMWWSFI